MLRKRATKNRGEYVINALQHVGLGVWDADISYQFYKRFFGFKVKLNDLTIPDQDMTPMIGSIETVRALMAMNIKGGGILELVQFKSSPIRSYPEDTGYGDYGILEVGYAVNGIDYVVEELRSQGVQFLTPVFEVPLNNRRTWRCAYLLDPNGLRLQLIEDYSPGHSRMGKPEVKGFVHIGIGVSDLRRSKAFYSSVLGFNKLVYQFKGHIPDMDPLTGEPLPMNLIILERSQPPNWPLDFLPSGTIKLFEVSGYTGKHIYNGRRWGDIGYMEFCLDVTDLQSVIADMKVAGIDIYLPPTEIDMGSGSKGMVAYIRDPDGTTIELVEVKSVAWVSKSLFRMVAMPFLRLYDLLT